MQEGDESQEPLDGIDLGPYRQGSHPRHTCAERCEIPTAHLQMA